MPNQRHAPLGAALAAVLLSLPALAAGQPSPGPGTWQASTADNGVRQLTYRTTASLLGKPVGASLRFFCDLTRSRTVNGTLGFDLTVSPVAPLAAFHFDDFSGPDASTGGRKLMQVTITRASRPPLVLALAPNGWSPEGTDFTFGVAEVSHVPESHEKTILRTLADDAVSFQVTITDSRNAQVKLDLAVPVAGRQADFRTLLAGLAAPPAAGPAGPADTAQARQVVADVNASLAQLKAAAFVAQRPDVEYKSNVRAWADAGGVRKLEVTDHDDAGDVVTEYYYAGGALVFVYQAIKGFNDAGRMVTRSEERQYFRGGKMFSWLSGMGQDRTENAPAGAEFADEARTRLAASAFLVKAADKALAAKAVAPGARVPAP